MSLRDHRKGALEPWFLGVNRVLHAHEECPEAVNVVPIYADQVWSLQETLNELMDAQRCWRCMGKR